MAWSQVDPTKAHVAYACIAVFCSVFSLISLFVKEKLYIGESVVATAFGVIVGPRALNWFSPTHWGNSDEITLEISRVVLCIGVVAVAVELPPKYMWKHGLSVTLMTIPTMIAGWLLVGLFCWILIPGINFAGGLLIAACITATDPILAQAVVSGKFAQKIPLHLRHLLSAESGCNDGLAFPFVFLSLDLIVHWGHDGLIVKDWICISVLYECVFGSLFGVFIGWLGKNAIKRAKQYNMIDRESFVAFYIIIAFMCAGFSSILGIDDLLASYFAGCAFGWDGFFTAETEGSNLISTIDVLLNYAYFVYFGAIIPWGTFNNHEIGLYPWRLILLAVVIIFLRRIPVTLVLKRFIPEITSWREALFVGHFGPIGVSALFAAITARSELEKSVTDEGTPLAHLPPKGTKHWQMIAIIWPVVCFIVFTSIIIHGSSVALLVLGNHLNSVTLKKPSSDLSSSEVSNTVLDTYSSNKAETDELNSNDIELSNFNHSDSYLHVDIPEDVTKQDTATSNDWLKKIILKFKLGHSSNKSPEGNNSTEPNASSTFSIDTLPAEFSEQDSYISRENHIYKRTSGNTSEPAIHMHTSASSLDTNTIPEYVPPDTVQPFSKLSKYNSGKSTKSRLSEISHHSFKTLKKRLKIPEQPHEFVYHGKTYHAYRVDNVLLIEDAEGEVLQKYSINAQGNVKKLTTGDDDLLADLEGILSEILFPVENFVNTHHDEELGRRNHFH